VSGPCGPDPSDPSRPVDGGNGGGGGGARPSPVLPTAPPAPARRKRNRFSPAWFGRLEAHGRPVRPPLPVPPQFHRGQHLREARDRRRPPGGGGAQGRVHSRGASVAVTVNKTACPKWPTRRRHGRAWYDKGSTAGPRPTFPSLLPVFQTHAGNAGRSGACSRGPDLPSGTPHATSVTERKRGELLRPCVLRRERWNS